MNLGDIKEDNNIRDKRADDIPSAWEIIKIAIRGAVFALLFGSICRILSIYWGIN